jgi:antitoxin PrlF
VKVILATLTEGGQVTVPVEVRRVLGIKPREKVAFTIEGDQVRLAPATFTLESAYGSVKPHYTPEDFGTMIAEAMDGHADEVVGEMTKPSSPEKPRPARRK